jgi:hypothetical protein
MHEDAVRRFLSVLICITFFASLYRRYISDASDPYHCTALLNEGQWLDEPSQQQARRAFQKWQPPGCLLHEYKGDDISKCAGNRQILFVGDSNVRQLFWAVAKKLNRNRAIEQGKLATRHGDIQYGDRGVDLRFIWDPYLNGTILANELEIYSENVGSGVSGGGGKKKGKKEQNAVMIVLGTGLWYARQYETGEALREFKSSIDSVVSHTTRSDGSAWKAVDPLHGWEGIGDQVFLLPVEEPVYSRLSPARQETIMPEEVDQMNEYLRKLTPAQGLTIPWVNQVMTANMKYAYEQSGIHVVESIANRRADIILNLRCNAKDDNAIGSPYERTCCSKYTSGNWFQWVLVVVSLIALPAAVVILPRSTSLGVPADMRTLVPSLAVIGLALSYCFFADRSQLFTKVQNVYIRLDFSTLTGLAFAIGLLTIRKTKEALARKTSTKDVFVTSSPTFLSREQTDEWKGWMQVIVLLYHWTAARTQLPLYITLRLLIASYLFITAYGHTMHFYRQEDYGLRRVAGVLIRLNLLPVLLSYQMYNNYLFYIFAPLVTFWILVIYATLRFGSELNGQPGFLLAKLGLSATLITLSHNHAQPTDTIFRWLRLVFGINWNAGDWRQYVSLDQFIPYVGMLVALLHIWYQNASASASLKGLERSEKGWASSLFLAAVTSLRPLAIVASITVVPLFCILVSRSPNEGDYNWWSAIISPLPILSYAVLRNAHPILRDHHSAAFAWLGRCSLETWTLSYHILRAADGRAVLSIGLFSTGDGSLKSDRWREAVLIVPILLWTAWQVSRATRKLTTWFVEGPGVQKRFLVLLVALWVLNLVSSHQVISRI